MQEIINLLKLKTGIFGDTLIYKTDSTLFYFRGYSDSFNPFQIDALKTEFQIRETVVINQQLKKAVDTFLVMQVIVYTDTTKNKLSLLRTELKRLNKEMLTVYQRAIHKRSSKKSKDVFETYSYYQEFARGLPIMKVGFGKYYRDPGKYNLIIETHYYYRPATISF